MSRPTLAISLETNDACDDVLLTDDTTDYAGTTTLNGVTGLVVVLHLASGDYLTYTFTIVNQVITVCTLSVTEGTATTITSELESTVWPLDEFSLFTDYGVDVPSLIDQVIEVDYTITGAVGSPSVAFSYTTSAGKTVSCEVCCCLTQKGQKLDPGCDCFEDKAWNYVLADTYLQVANFSTNVGNIDRAQLALDKATQLCDESCEC